MPVDGKGNFRHNTESVMMHDKAASPDNQKSEGGNVHELEDHGDRRPV